MRRGGYRPNAVSELIAERLRSLPPPVNWRQILDDLIKNSSTAGRC